MENIRQRDRMLLATVAEVMGDILVVSRLSVCPASPRDVVCLVDYAAEQLLKL